MAQLLSQVAVGTVISITHTVEKTYEYIVVHQGLPGDMYDQSCDGTWLLKKTATMSTRWAGSSSSADVGNLFVDSNIANTESLYATMPDIVKDKVKHLRIPYYSGGRNGQILSGSNGYLCHTFLLSGAELGFTGTAGSVGAKLDYFIQGEGSSANAKRDISGYQHEYWTRDAYSGNSSDAWFVDTNGISDRIPVQADTKIVFECAVVDGDNLMLMDDGTLANAPNPPSSIIVPAVAMPGQSIQVSWEAVDTGGES